jgi:hypothetical protein
VKGSGVFAMLMYLKGCSIYELGPFRFIYDAKELNDLPKQGWYTKPKIRPILPFPTSPRMSWLS